LGMKGDGMILRSKKSSDVWVFKEVLKKIWGRLGPDAESSKFTKKALCCLLININTR
jgi:hypothetical protein